jgi:hypothetical protein
MFAWDDFNGFVGFALERLKSLLMEARTATGDLMYTYNHSNSNIPEKDMPLNRVIECSEKEDAELTVRAKKFVTAGKRGAKRREKGKRAL